MRCSAASTPGPVAQAWRCCHGSRARAPRLPVRTAGNAARAARAQVLLAALLRPGAESKLRRLWNLGHWWLGRAALVVALGNLFLSLRLGGEGLLAFLVLAALVAAWLLAGATKDLVDYLRLPPPGEEELGKKTFQDRMVEARARAPTLTP